MALIVEDGSIVSGANTYVIAVDYVAFALARGVTVVDADQELTKAIDYLETLDYSGQKVSSIQPLQFPRSGIVIDGFAVSTTEIPQELIIAQMMTAIEVHAGNDPLATVERKVSSEQLDSMSITYADDSASTAKLTSIDAYLRKLISGGGNTVQLSVYR